MTENLRSNPVAISGMVEVVTGRLRLAVAIVDLNQLSVELSSRGSPWIGWGI